MHTNEDRISAMHRRAAEIQREKRKRPVRGLNAGSAALGLALAVLPGVRMPKLAAGLPMETAAGSASASIFNQSGALGYVVTALLAFLLGVCVAVVCIRLKKWHEEGIASDKEQNETLSSVS